MRGRGRARRGVCPLADAGWSAEVQGTRIGGFPLADAGWNAEVQKARA
ncbi:hypothetical protein OEIGOIKO_03327 [Streptomyces chrestomyceticus JCM 4735]|uniref:Uncharacterized protein n=1 Tax=Streptomyces chrestomyceticus JCM 4735 TaxID=1306181 RepID=A0A7U9KVK6_9ACTN|nr:hypothetical protein OEIGOIKO_03327 [Streptomyces chrestomyceticus JCM 4735]